MSLFWYHNHQPVFQPPVDELIFEAFNIIISTWARGYSEEFRKLNFISIGRSGFFVSRSECTLYNELCQKNKWD
jgi:hypothetical protein